MLFALIGVIAAEQVTKPIGCNSLYIFNSWACNMAILCATTSLMAHTVGLWDKNISIVLPFALLGCAHWAILWRAAFTVEAAYSQQDRKCVLVSENHTLLTASFFMTVAVDLTVLLVALVALVRSREQLALRDVLLQGGIVYICIPFLSSITPAILSALNLNATMNVIAVVPAATMSAIAAGRLVMRLEDVSERRYARNPAALTVHSGKCFPAGRRSHTTGIRPTPEVHVTTDRVTFEDFPALPQRAVRASNRTNSDGIPELGSRNEGFKPW